MSAIDSRPASRTVIVLLALVVLALAVFLAPADAEGSATPTAAKIGAKSALANPDKCLTQNQKAVNCGRSKAVHSALSEGHFYSLYARSKTDIGKDHELVQVYREAGVCLPACGYVAVRLNRSRTELMFGAPS